MRTHEASPKKSSDHKSNAPTANPLASRPFAVQPTHEETEQSQEKAYERTLSDFAILNPERGRSMPVQPKLAIAQAAYNPSNLSGQELLAHEVTHVVQQRGAVIQRVDAPPATKMTPEQIKHANRIRKARGLPLIPQSSPIAAPDSTSTLNSPPTQTSESITTQSVASAQNDPQNPDQVKAMIEAISDSASISEDKARDILKNAFYSNWFLAKQHLLNEENPRELQQKLKELMKTLLKLRQKETNNLLEDVQAQLCGDKQFNEMLFSGNMKAEDILSWSAAGSESLTSDIDVNLKGAGSIQAVGLFNKLFKTKFGWPFEPGTVYDVNVYAQDFMTPKNGNGKPFEKNDKKNSLTPVQEIPELNAQDKNTLSTLAFDAFALNQDVWSLVKMRIHMEDSEWETYRQEMLNNAKGDSKSDDALAREMQVQAQLEDAEGYYKEYKENLKRKIDAIDKSQDAIYQNMRQALKAGKGDLSEHQEEGAKNMMAANMIYEEKLEKVSSLRQELQKLQKEEPLKVSKIKECGIKLKNALSEAIIYANEAYLTQGAVHFSVIGQQIGKGESLLVMSEEEHLHSFREQVGDTLKVLNEYSEEPVYTAIRKAGKYIDRMAKSALPLMKTQKSKKYQDLAEVGAAAAKLKADKTALEENIDKEAKLGEKADITDKEREKLEEAKQAIPKLEKSIPEQENSLKELSKKYETVQEIRKAVTEVGREVEKDFRKFQVEKNEKNKP